MDGPAGEQSHEGIDEHADLRDGSLGRDFRQAWAGSRDVATANPELLPVRLARACVDVLGVDGAGISLFHSDFRVPVGASDDVATVAERLQFTQGEGPCLASAATHRMVVADANELESRWPSFTRELFDLTPFRAVASLPLAVTRQSFAALDLFLIEASTARRLTLNDAYAVSEQVVTALAGAIDEALATRATPYGHASPGSDPADDLMPVWLTAAPTQARTYVWVAMGMAMTKFDLTAADAIALLRSYAYGHNQMLDDVATGLVTGSISLAEMQP